MLGSVLSSPRAAKRKYDEVSPSTTPKRRVQGLRHGLLRPRDHGRQKPKCKDCGTGYCDHGRQKSQCKDCGTGYCQHGRRKSQCKGRKNRLTTHNEGDSDGLDYY